MSIVVRKTKTETRVLKNIALNMLDRESFIKVRKDKKSCWFCRKKFIDMTDTHLSLLFTSKGNEIICTECTLYFKDKGLEVNDWNKNIKPEDGK